MKFSLKQTAASTKQAEQNYSDTIAKERENILYLLIFVVDVMLLARTVPQNKVRTWQITIRICANKLN